MIVLATKTVNAAIIVDGVADLRGDLQSAFHFRRHPAHAVHGLGARQHVLGEVVHPVIQDTLLAPQRIAHRADGIALGLDVALVVFQLRDLGARCPQRVLRLLPGGLDIVGAPVQDITPRNHQFTPEE